MRYVFLMLLTGFLFAGCGRDASPSTDFAAPPAAAPVYQPRTDDGTERQKENTDGAGIKAESLELPEEKANEVPVTREEARNLSPVNRGKRKQTTTQQAPQSAGTQQGAPTSPEKITTMTVPKVIDVNTIDALEVFRVYTSPCYGDCKEYAVTLYNNGLVILHGKKNVRREGYYSLILENYQQSDLMEAFRAATAEGLFTIYPVDEPVAADVPSTVLAYPGNDGKDQRIRVYADAPEALQALFTLVEEMAETASWKAAKG